MPAADQRQAVIGAAEADQLLAPLLSHDHLTLAVSGGSDSTALMLMAARWVQARDDAPEFSVLTVDHGLRPESAQEAMQVGRWAKALGFEHHTLHWQAAKPASGMQAAAREARYQLMSDWCLAHGAKAIVTGHTANDQAETVLMRLARGSGVDGLAGMMRDTLSPWPVLRPLLGITRERLRATLVAADHGWIDDPSNDDERFERIRMRKTLAILESHGLDVESIALSARRLARARHALDLAGRDLVRSSLTCHETGFGEFDLPALLDAPAELQLRALQMLVWQFGSHEMPRMAALERVAEWIACGEGRARTISGCRIVRRKRQLVLGREPGRIERAPSPLSFRAGCTETLWDRRFRVVVHGARESDQLSVVPLGGMGGGPFRKARGSGPEMPAFVRESLPVLLDHGAMHSVPHLGILGTNVNPNLIVDVEFLAN